MLSRIELKAFCVLGRRDNRYTTAPELIQVAFFLVLQTWNFCHQCICQKLRKTLHVIMNFRHVSGNFSGVI